MTARPSGPKLALGFIGGIFLLIMGIASVRDQPLYGALWLAASLVILGRLVVYLLPARQATEGSGAGSVEMRLDELDGLLDQDMITTEEYEERRSHLLKQA